MITEKEARWVERMQRLGFFPSPPRPKDPPEEGAFRMTYYPNRTVLVEINMVPMSRSQAMAIVGLCVER